MKQNLDVLKTEITEYIDSRKLAVFHSYARVIGDLSGVSNIAWDVTGHPDFREFIAVAEAAGVKLITLRVSQFSSMFVDNALEDIETADLLPDERRSMERRLRDLRAYDGFTSEIELSFDLGHRTYVFELRTEWYEDFNDLLNELDLAAPGDSDDEEDDDGPIGGYFSKN